MPHLRRIGHEGHSVVPLVCRVSRGAEEIGALLRNDIVRSCVSIKGNEELTVWTVGRFTDGSQHGLAVINVPHAQAVA